MSTFAVGNHPRSLTYCYNLRFDYFLITSMKQMEKTMKIQKLLPIQDRQYNDQQGWAKVFTSMGFVLTDGVDTMYAEATGDYARSLVGHLNEGDTVRSQLSTSVRSWQDQQGQTRYENKIYISTIKAI